MSAPQPNAYLRTKVMTASPAELRMMLFEGAIRFAEQAKLGLERKDFDQVYTGVTRCQSILLELINSLRPEHDPDLCEKLSALYTFMYTRLMHASTERSPAIVDEVLKLLQYERETWSMVLEELARENVSATEMGVDAMAGAGAVQGTAGQGLVGGRLSVRG